MSQLIPVDVVVKLNIINDNVKKIPLFILAGIEGNCDVFKDLANNLTDSNIQVYGLQFNNDVPLDSIKSMAIYYLKKIENELKHFHDNKNEFYLASYSYSGPIAIEIAVHLEENKNKINLKKLFLFDTSHCFFKIGAHLNFQTFQHEIIDDNIFNHTHIYTAVLSIYLSNLYGLNKHKFDIYEKLKKSKNLEDSIDQAFKYLDEKSLVSFDNEEILNENKQFLKLLLLKSASCHLYNYSHLHKLKTKVYLFKPKLFIYSKNLENYFKIKNSIKFNKYNYNLGDIVNNLKIYEYNEGTHWSFIIDNLNEISTTIKINILNITSKL